MASRDLNMPREGGNNKSARTRVADLSSLFTSVSRLQQSVDEDRYEKELENLRQLEKVKIKILEKQKKLELDWIKEKRKLEKEATKEQLEQAEKLHKQKMAQVVDEYKQEIEVANILEKELSDINKKNQGLFGNVTSGWRQMLALGEAGFSTQGVGALIKGLSNFIKQFDNKIEEIASYQNKVNTRLFGSSRKWEGLTGISTTITAATAMSPYVRTADVMKNVNDLVDKGIAFNIEQRAFLNTIKDSIATTFDAANGTLLQLIRIQQADTTAARLGMEAALNKYLNSMYQTTEYLSDLASGVKSSIYEATALMSAQAGVSFEYQVQKWLGSLYSVGMSQAGVSSIAQALGQLGSGDVTSLAGTSMQNLLVMSASRAGLSYADMLTKGLDESGTNKLLQAMVDYLASIASDNRVVQSAYAKVFGLTSSDIIAASTLSSDIGSIAKSTLSYSGAMGNLRNMTNTMAQRLSVGGMMSNLWDNLQYNLSESIASNPALYAVWKAAGLLDEAVGGIAIPSIGAFTLGTGLKIDLNTTVADLMRVGTLGGSLLGSIGKMVTGLVGAIVPQAMLGMLGINDNLSTVGRGRSAMFESGTSLSTSIYRGQQSSADVYETMMTEADVKKEEAYNRTVNPEEEQEEEDIKLRDLDTTVQSIYNLLSSVIMNDSIKTINGAFGAYN